MTTVYARWDLGDVRRLDKLVRAATKAAARKAGSTAMRDMRSEATKRVRARKRLRAATVRRAITPFREGAELDAMVWGVRVSGATVRLIDYPGVRQGKRGVTAQVNPGKRTLLRGAFIATMASGHKGVFRRRGPGRLPIDEVLASRPVDALLHEGEAAAVAARGQTSLIDTFARLLPLELAKGAG